MKLGKSTGDTHSVRNIMRDYKALAASGELMSCPSGERTIC